MLAKQHPPSYATSGLPSPDVPYQFLAMMERYLSTEFPVRISLGFCMKFPVFKELRRSDCFANMSFYRI
jgi:hypothetical protein